MSDAPATLADLADRNLRRDIVAGVLKPGERLTAVFLTQRYQIGASPMREALSRLWTDHLVVLEGKKGFTVAPTSVAELDDISACRRLVETEAVRLSVEAGDETWQSNLVAAFYRLDRAEERVRSNAVADLNEWESRNREFHEAVLSACASVWLKRLQRVLYSQHERYRRLSLLNHDPARDLRAEHRDIMQACLDGDPAKAAQLSADHIDKTAAAVRAVLAAAAPNPRRQRTKPRKATS